MYQIGSRWLSQLNDQISVADVSFPGTHDSAAFESYSKLHLLTQSFWKTQNQNFENQLRQGIRVFDIRLQIQENQKAKLFHGPIELCPIKNMSQAFNTFLKQNPKQFIIFVLRKQRGSVSDKRAGQIFKSQMNLQMLPMHYSQRVPILRQVRGKIWVITTNVKLNTFQAKTHRPILLEQDKFWVQNLWNGPQNQKQDAIKKIIAKNTKPRLIKINFLNQSFGSSTENVLSIFIGNILDKISLTKMSQHYNSICLKALNNLEQGISAGIILADFPSQELIQGIIQCNKHLPRMQV